MPSEGSLSCLSGSIFILRIGRCRLTLEAYISPTGGVRASRDTQGGMGMAKKTSTLPEGSNPDLGQCRVASIGSDTYVECLCAGPNDCRYALPFGYGFLCQHPKFNAFLRKDAPPVAPPASSSN